MKQSFGIEDTEECNKFLQDAINDKGTFISLDSETTGLYLATGMLSISLCYDGNEQRILLQIVLMKNPKNSFKRCFGRSE